MTWTGRYIAPEVFGNEEYDTAADVFSFALILQEVTLALGRKSSTLSALSFSFFCILFPVSWWPLFLVEIFNGPLFWDQRNTLHEAQMGCQILSNLMWFGAGLQMYICEFKHFVCWFIMQDKRLFKICHTSMFNESNW